MAAGKRGNGGDKPRSPMIFHRWVLDRSDCAGWGVPAPVEIEAVARPRGGRGRGRGGRGRGRGKGGRRGGRGHRRGRGNTFEEDLEDSDSDGGGYVEQAPDLLQVGAMLQQCYLQYIELHGRIVVGTL